MDDRSLLDELVRVATRLGVEVRIEPFETPPAGGGGRCLLAGRDLILLDARASLRDRVAALASALADRNLDDVYLTPEARDRVEAERDAQVAPRERVPLAPLSTMGVGGPARWYVEARDEATVLAALDWGERRGVPVRVLGGGSNLVVADTGVEGLVLQIALRGVAVREVGPAVELTAAAGEPWDGLVRSGRRAGWAGLECLSGIPGLVGATPIQNVGAYGQDVSETVAAVRALDRAAREIVTLTPAACGFAYRDSVFRSRAPERYVVLGVTYRLRPGGAPAVRYADVERHLGERGIAAPTLADVRESVLAIRRGKSMVLERRRPERAELRVVLRESGRAGGGGGAHRGGRGRSGHAAVARAGRRAREARRGVARRARRVRARPRGRAGGHLDAPHARDRRPRGRARGGRRARRAARARQRPRPVRRAARPRAGLLGVPRARRTACREP